MTKRESTNDDGSTSSETVASATELYDLLQGIDGSTTTAELRALAGSRDAGPAAVRALERLPDQDWPSVQAAVLTATTGWY